MHWATHLSRGPEKVRKIMRRVLPASQRAGMPPFEWWPGAWKTTFKCFLLSNTQLGWHLGLEYVVILVNDQTALAYQMLEGFSAARWEVGWLPSAASAPYIGWYRLALMANCRLI